MISLRIQCSILVGLTMSSVAAFASPLVRTTSSQLKVLQHQSITAIHSTRSYSLLRSQTSPLYATLALPRGGAAGFAAKLAQNPQSLFNTTLLTLALMTAAAKLLQRAGRSNEADNAPKKPDAIKSLQLRFLAVFWLLRCSDWLQGPYFYEVYASKLIDGAQASMSLVSRLFLTGFASTALFGPVVGKAADQYGRKKATLAFTVLYALGALSTKSTLLQVLFLGRILSGIGTSLLFSAPESWLVGAALSNKDDPDGKYLGETFGLAYAGDSIVAILAGQMAGTAALHRGPTGPFELSTLFLGLGAVLAALLWTENKAKTVDNKKPSIGEAIQVVKKDPKIMLVGATQSMFEAAMYIFVLQWPPAIAKAVSNAFGESATTPYGTVFSCFMACCLLGSTLFGQLTNMNVATEKFTAAMLAVATAAMTLSTVSLSQPVFSLAALAASFFVFEACVGMYFPSIGTLRSKYVPDSHRSVIMNLFGIPLNVLVVSVFLSMSKLGLTGALSISSGALGIATLCMLALNRTIKT